jgi:hypothetical protein
MDKARKGALKMMDLNWYFDELKKAIEPDPKYKKHAQEADDPVREYLRSDASFADYYANSFLYGSYARSTAIGNIKDVDLVIVCNYSKYSSPLTLLNTLRESLVGLYGNASLGDQRRSIRVDEPLPDIPDSKLTLDVIPAIYQNGDSPERRLKTRAFRSARQNDEMVVETSV